MVILWWKESHISKSNLCGDYFRKPKERDITNFDIVIIEDEQRVSIQWGYNDK